MGSRFLFWQFTFLFTYKINLSHWNEIMVHFDLSIFFKPLFMDVVDVHGCRGYFWIMLDVVLYPCLFWWYFHVYRAILYVLQFNVFVRFPKVGPKTVRRLSVWWMRVCVVSSPISHSIQVKMVNLMSLILFYYIQSFYSLKPWDHKSTHNPITWLDSSSDQSYYGFSISSNQCSQPKVFSKWKKNRKKFTIPTYVEDSFEQ